MKVITIGKPFEGKFDFRETCFGICEKNGKILLTKKCQSNELAMVGGGIEKTENHFDCLSREFLEESGYIVKSAAKLCIVDCYWLAAGKWPMRSLANFYIVDVEEKVVKPTEEGHNPIWIDLTEAMDVLSLPYQKEGFSFYMEFKKNNLENR